MRVALDDGAVINLGTTETTPTISFTDYSRRVTDDFGVTTVVERSFSRRMSVRLAVPFADVDALQRQLAGLRATAATWTADDRFEWLSMRGFYKDFALDLAVPPVSFCTLSVEGLAASEVIADPGGDPAPSGASTLRLLQPVTGSVLVNSSVPEDDAPLWSGTTAYPIGARVIRGGEHRIFESLIAGNVGREPKLIPAAWLDVGPTNRWAMLDQALGSVTSAVGSIDVTLNAGADVGVVLLDVTGSTVRVVATGYDSTIAVTSGAITFLNLPADPGPVVVTIAGSGPVSVGTLLIGPVVALGVTEAAPTAGITDYSRKDIDDFGEVTVVERAWAKRMAVKALIRTDAVDVVANRIAAVRARPSLWIANEGLDSLTVYGFFKDFSIEVGESVSKLSLSIEGLSTAGKVEPLRASVDWPDIGDPLGTKPVDNATVGGTIGTDIRNADGTLYSPGAALAALEAALAAEEARARADVQAARDAVDAARAELEASDTAIRQTIVDVEQETAGVRAHVDDRVATLAGVDAALAGRIQTIEVDYTTSGEVDAIAGAKVSQEAIARADAIGAVVARNDFMVAEYNAVDARVTSEVLARATAIGAVVARNDQMVIEYNAVGAALEEERIARVDAQGATALHTSVLEVSSGGNLLGNSDFAGGKTGWSLVTNTPASFLWDVDVAGFAVAGDHYQGLLCLERNGDLSAALVSDWVAMTPGDVVQISAWLAARECVARIRIQWGDGGGAFLRDAAQSDAVSAPYTGWVNLDQWKRVWCKDTVPADARFARLVLDKGPFLASPGMDLSWAFLMRPMLALGSAAQTTPSPYRSTGGGAGLKGAVARVTQSEIATADLYGRTSARWKLEAITPGGRAQLSVYSDSVAGAGVDVVGDLSVSGNVLVGGTVSAGKFDKTTTSREGSSTWSGNVAPAPGQTLGIPFSLTLTGLLPQGRFIYEYSADVQTNAGLRETTTLNGRPAYTDYIGDGGLSVRSSDGQGNVYQPAIGTFQPVLASTPFDTTFVASITRGATDTGYVLDGDVYYRQVSAAYVVGAIRLHVVWIAI